MQRNCCSISSFQPCVENLTSSPRNTRKCCLAKFDGWKDHWSKNTVTPQNILVFTLSTPRNTRKCCLSTIVVVCSIDATKISSRSKHALAPCVSRQQTGSSREAPPPTVDDSRHWPDYSSLSTCSRLHSPERSRDEVEAWGAVDPPDMHDNSLKMHREAESAAKPANLQAEAKRNGGKAERNNRLNDRALRTTSDIPVITCCDHASLCGCSTLNSSRPYKKENFDVPCGHDRDTLLWRTFKWRQTFRLFLFSSLLETVFRIYRRAGKYIDQWVRGRFACCCGSCTRTSCLDCGEGLAVGKIKKLGLKFWCTPTCMNNISLHTHRYVGLRNSGWAEISVFLMVIHVCTATHILWRIVGQMTTKNCNTPQHTATHCNMSCKGE